MAMSRLQRAAMVGAILLAGLGQTATAQSYKLGAIRVDHPWSRPTPPSAPTAVGYLTITNTGNTADRLLGGASPHFERIEAHEMSMAGGVMTMRPITGGMEIGPGKTVSLAPGGRHLMLIRPKQPLKLGDRIPVTLRFARAGQVKVNFVTENPPSSGHSH